MSQAVTPKTVGLVFCHCVRVGVGVFWIILFRVSKGVKLHSWNPKGRKRFCQ